MIDPPHIVETQLVPTAMVRLTIAAETCMDEFGPAVGDVFAALDKFGIESSGPVFSHHLQLPSDIFDFEVGVPVASAFTSQGRVIASALPATTAARTIYHGPYEGLPDAWGEFMDWIEANGHAPSSTLWETYVVGPAQTDDAAQWQTELTRPLADSPTV